MRGYGNYDDSRLWPRDFTRIRDLAALSDADRRARLHALGDRAANNLRRVLPQAAGAHREVICVTHVPPFREACVDAAGRESEPRLPFYTCKAVGDVLLEVAERFPGCQFTVLCGHTHEECTIRPCANLRVMVKAAGYGSWYTPHILTLGSGTSQVVQASMECV